MKATAGNFVGDSFKVLTLLCGALLWQHSLMPLAACSAADNVVPPLFSLHRTGAAQFKQTDWQEYHFLWASSARRSCFIYTRRTTSDPEREPCVFCSWSVVAGWHVLVRMSGPVLHRCNRNQNELYCRCKTSRNGIAAPPAWCMRRDTNNPVARITHAINIPWLNECIKVTLTLCLWTGS